MTGAGMKAEWLYEQSGIEAQGDFLTSECCLRGITSVILDLGTSILIGTKCVGLSTTGYIEKPCTGMVEFATSQHAGMEWCPDGTHIRAWT